MTVNITMSSIGTLALRGIDGDDQFNIAGSLPYENLIIDGGNPSASDIVNLTSPSRTIDGEFRQRFALSTNTTITGYGGTITLQGDEAVNLDARRRNTSPSTAPRSHESITYTPTDIANWHAYGAAGLNTSFNFIDVSAPSPPAACFIDPMGGADTVIVNGTAGDDDITASVIGDQYLRSGQRLLSQHRHRQYRKPDRSTGGNGDDSLQVDASSGPVLIPIVFDGGTGRDSLSLDRRHGRQRHLYARPHSR